MSAEADPLENFVLGRDRKLQVDEIRRASAEPWLTNPSIGCDARRGYAHVAGLLNWPQPRTPGRVQAAWYDGKGRLVGTDELEVYGADGELNNIYVKASPRGEILVDWAPRVPDGKPVRLETWIDLSEDKQLKEARLAAEGAAAQASELAAHLRDAAVRLGADVLIDATDDIPIVVASPTAAYFERLRLAATTDWGWFRLTGALTELAPSATTVDAVALDADGGLISHDFIDVRSGSSIRSFGLDAPQAATVLLQLTRAEA